MTNFKTVFALGAFATTLTACGGDPELEAKIEDPTRMLIDL